MSRLRQFIVAASLAVVSHAASAGFSGLYVFGDSLSDSGNLALVIGADPAQVITGNTYIPSKPYASGQFTNGNVWARDYATAIGLSSFGLPSLAGGGDYAFGGARVATDGSGLPPSLAAQTGMFLSGHGGVASSTALYVIAGGGNDARDTLVAAATAVALSQDPTPIIGAAALAYAQATGALIDQLQAAGAQRIVVWDVPDLGKAPAVTAAGAGASFLGTAIASAMNLALAGRVGIEGPNVSIFDIFGLQDLFVANPGAFGFIDVTHACGAPSNNCDPATALSWDGIHPTAAAHLAIADAMLTAVPEPAEYALMVAGLALIGARLRRRPQAARVAA